MGARKMASPVSPLRAACGMALILLAIPLASCGFTPLYATPGVVSGLSAIDVEAPDGRIAYLMRERLDDAFARDRGVPAAYRLDRKSVV